MPTVTASSPRDPRLAAALTGARDAVAASRRRVAAAALELASAGSHEPPSIPATADGPAQARTLRALARLLAALNATVAELDAARLDGSPLPSVASPEPPPAEEP